MAENQVKVRPTLTDLEVGKTVISPLKRLRASVLRLPISDLS